MKRFLLISMLLGGILYIPATAQLNGSLFRYENGWQPRWSSPENPGGGKGQGGRTNNGAKGHPFDSLEVGQSLTLLNVKGMGIVNRIWLTISDQSPEALRGLKIEMFWDGEAKPAVAVPLGDFFGGGLGQKVAFQNALFADPEGRSFNCFVPMPFKKAAKIVVTNESPKTIVRFFFDVDYSFIPEWKDDYMYFHAYWHRDTSTELAKDFTLLPQVTGRGRFLGVNVSIITNPLYQDSWWGEGEVKMYLDGDKAFPTLNGTGTEDYIGTAWGQHKFINNYTGCLIADDSLKQWSFYRYHIPDPVFFSRDCRVTIQQLGGTGAAIVARYQQKDIPVIPVAMDTGSMHNFYTPGKIVKIDTSKYPKAWVNFYRKDDVAATAYFYLDTPADGLPPLQPAAIRTYDPHKGKE